MTATDSTEGQRFHDPAAYQQRAQHEASIKRNPHPDFQSVEKSRPDWDEQRSWTFTKTRDTKWSWGQGGNDGGESLKKDSVEINPHAEGRPPTYNYKLLISGIIPRPIGFLSTVSKDGNISMDTRTQELHTDAPFRVISESRSIFIH